MNASQTTSIRNPMALEDMCEGLAEELAAYHAALDLQLMADSTPEGATIAIDPESLPASVCDCVFALGVIPGAHLTDANQMFATCERRLRFSQQATQSPLE